MTIIVGKLFEHIEPLVIGAVERAYALSRLITQKVLETHLDSSKEKEKIDRIVNKIGGEYFSHSFPITRRDVERELQLKVEKPDPELFEAMWKLYEYYRGCFSNAQHMTLSMEQRGLKGQVARADINIIVHVLGYIDALSDRRVLVQIRQVGKDPNSDMIRENIVSTRWIKPQGPGLPVTHQSFYECKPPQQ